VPIIIVLEMHNECGSSTDPDAREFPVNDRLDRPVVVGEDIPIVEVAVEQPAAKRGRVAQTPDPRSRRSVERRDEALQRFEEVPQEVDCWVDGNDVVVGFEEGGDVGWPRRVGRDRIEGFERLVREVVWFGVEVAFDIGAS
jgi:hypothetical protein